MNNYGNNRYYDWWKHNKPMLSLLPAIVFWLVSMIFFVVGLNFKNPIVIFNTDVSFWIAISLSLSNTIIQIIGNEQEQEGLGLALWIGWIGSYALGIGTNVVGLLSILSINSVVLEWVIAIGLGSMIEVLPERLVVQFLKTFKSKNYKPNKPNPYSYPPNTNSNKIKHGGQSKVSPPIFSEVLENLPKQSQHYAKR